MSSLIKYFDFLTPRELYQILKIRQEVFMLEQQILCSDCDGVDYNAWHIMGVADDGRTIVGCARLFKGAENGVACIGRLAVAMEYRDRQIGRSIMDAALNIATDNLKAKIVEIHAQSHVIPFYEKLGFVVSSDEFLEEGVPHRKMTIDLKQIRQYWI